MALLKNGLASTPVAVATIIIAWINSIVATVRPADDTVVVDDLTNCTCNNLPAELCKLGRRVINLAEDLFFSAAAGQGIFFRLEVDESFADDHNFRRDKFTFEQLNQALRVERIDSTSIPNSSNSFQWFISQKSAFDWGLFYLLVFLACCAAIACRIGVGLGRLSVFLRVAAVYFLILFIVSVPFNFYYLYRAELAKQYATLIVSNDGVLAERCLLSGFSHVGSEGRKIETGSRQYFRGVATESDSESVFDTVWRLFAFILPNWFGSRRADAEAECERFYAALLNAPRVTPIQAFSYTLWSTVFEPLEHLGDFLAHFLGAFSLIERLLVYLVLLALAFAWTSGSSALLAIYWSFLLRVRSNVAPQRLPMSPACAVQTDYCPSVAHEGSTTQILPTAPVNNQGVRIFDEEDALHIAYDAEDGQLFARIVQRSPKNSDDTDLVCVQLARYRPTQQLNVYEASFGPLMLDVTQLESLSRAIPRIQAALRQRL